MRSIGGCERFKGGGRKNEMNIVGMVFIQYNTMKKFYKLQLIDIINNYILMENVDLFNTRSSTQYLKSIMFEPYMLLYKCYWKLDAERNCLPRHKQKYTMNMKCNWIYLHELFDYPKLYALIND